MSAPGTLISRVSAWGLALRRSVLPLGAALLAGCAGPSIDVDLASAKETFKQRQLSNSNAAPELKTQDSAASLAAAQPLASEGDRRRLVQFRYGEKSLADPVFAAYLKNHGDNFAGDQLRKSESWSP
ncbi:MAG: hypothetical protein RLY67_186, partial [Pseudomonadota bacterium]